MVIAKPPHDRIPRNTVAPADGAKAQSCTAKPSHFLDLAFIDLTRGAENFSCGYGLFKARPGPAAGIVHFLFCYPGCDAEYKPESTERK